MIGGQKKCILQGVMLLVTLIILDMRRLIDGQANMKGCPIGGVVL